MRDKFQVLTPFTTFAENELPSNPLDKEVWRYLNNAKVKNIPWLFSGFPNETFKNDVGGALMDYVRGNMTWDEVEKKIKDSWKRAAM